MSIASRSALGWLGLATCGGLLWVGGAPTARAATVSVANCGDGGAGSLRVAVAGAASGDTVDLRNLPCNRIELTSGAIMVQQPTLTLRGPAYRKLTVSGHYTSSVFRHSGAGTLTLSGMTIEHGQYRHEPNAAGGCVYSAGNVVGTDVVIRHCGAYGRVNAKGGAIHAEGNVSLWYSALYSNGVVGAGSSGGAVSAGSVLPGPVYVGGHVRAHRVRFSQNTAGDGGAIWALDGLTMTYSTVADNHARAAAGGLQIGSLNGGEILIADSTLSGNSAGDQAGAFHMAPNATIVNSTISNNSSPFISAGYASEPFTIANSTIAFNRTTTPYNCTGAVMVSVAIRIDSSIFADNLCNDVPAWDISGNGSMESPLVTGANNLVESAGIDPRNMPSDTIKADPQLQPLADNGGRTLTHMLGAGSPAIDRGNNLLGLDTDQRGPGYARVKGPRADIGAIER